MKPPLHYILFKVHKKQPKPAGMFQPGFYNLHDFMSMMEDRAAAEECGYCEKPEPKKEETVMEFVCSVKNPKEVAQLVRKDPLATYVLFHGEVLDVNVPIPVLVKGRSLDTLTDEWGEADPCE